MRTRLLFSLVCASLAACGGSRTSGPAAPSEPAAGVGSGGPAVDTPSPNAVASPAASAGAPSGVPLFEGLGSYRRPVSTSSAEADRYFQQGLAFLYAFNHDEAIRSFSKAAALDPTFALASWGVALANGPHINNPGMDEAHDKAAWEALGKAKALAARASDVERALIDALAKRYAWPAPKDRAPLDEAYAKAMREVWKAYPGDPDVGALFAEAMMDLRPRALWTEDGRPEPGTTEITATLEAVLARTPQHPLANHLYIHAVEASSNPEKADGAADRLRSLQPGLGHMVHMPSHIDVRRGRWEQAATANEKAIDADRRYLARAPRPGFYAVYVSHNHHMLAYAAMMEGASARAFAASKSMLATIGDEALADRDTALMLDGFIATPLEVQMRFGRWDELLAEPERKGELPLYRTLRFYARGVAYAAKGQLKEAEAEQRAFTAARARIPKGHRFGNNEADAIAGVAEAVLRGEIAFRAGKKDVGIQALREAVAREDALRYDEPPDWIQPTRHALGAALLKAGRAAEAEAVYAEDLRRLPHNGWSLVGLGRAQKALGKKKDAEDTEARFQKAWARADIPLSSSCFCQPWDN